MAKSGTCQQLTCQGSYPLVPVCIPSITSSPNPASPHPALQGIHCTPRCLSPGLHASSLPFGRSTNTPHLPPSRPTCHGRRQQRHGAGHDARPHAGREGGCGGAALGGQQRHVVVGHQRVDLQRAGQGRAGVGRVARIGTEKCSEVDSRRRGEGGGWTCNVVQVLICR